MKQKFVDFSWSRKNARNYLPKLVFDFIEGGAGEENGLQRNRDAFTQTLLLPRVLKDPDPANIQTAFLGKNYARPFGCAPMGLCNLAHPQTDLNLAKAAAQYQFPICVSAASSTSLETYIEQADGYAWFQLYVTGDMTLADTLIERAEAAGYENIILTVDVPRLARRPRDTKNGFQTPFKLNFAHFIDFARHPAWSLQTLRAGVPKMANYDLVKSGGYDRNAPRRGANWTYLERLRERWKKKLIIKGVVSVDDAIKIKSLGADALYVSNHGGRQLDSAPSTLKALLEIRAALGPDYPLILDGGIRQGEDLVKALAQGAHFAMMGRPFLYASASRLENAIPAMVEAFSSDFEIALAQLGIENLNEIGAKCLAVS
ncbi:MAG: alpha-hydroxy-acid oxidizing protein [Methylocystaceae bacterium]|nr:alpha-hydroxy-acid oxidizing protein [Methylocystaceae bacterium]